MSAFDTAPEFFLEDERRNRKHNPISKTILELKCETLLPEWLVKDGKILDLGCCLGAMGHWALKSGAHHYTGIEIQQDFVERANQMLGVHWNSDVYSIIHSDLFTFLASEVTDSFDIVVCAGVLHCTMEPQQLIREMCRVSKRWICIENNVVSDEPVIVLGKKLINLPDGNSNRALAASPSLSAVACLMKTCGFLPDGGHRLPLPEMKTAAAYTKEYQDTGDTLRYFARYRKSEISSESTLQTDLRNDQLSELKLWSRMRNKTGTTKEEPKWKFDKRVAKDFDSISQNSIPDYSKVIHRCADYIEQVHGKEARVIDVGSATGNTLKILHDRGFNSLLGVDNSEDMLAVGQQKLPSVRQIFSETFPSAYGPFDVVLANWTLHFVDQRDQYLSRAADSLVPQGTLILTEKTSQTPEMRNLYHAWKHQNGLSKKEIEAKSRLLTGVLKPWPVHVYFELLNRVGFIDIQILHADLGFVTYVARKADS